MSIDEGPFQNIVDLVMPEAFPPVYTLSFDTLYQRGININTNNNAPFADIDCNTSCQAKAWVIANNRMIANFGRANRWKGLGWEDPPHPAIRLTGQSSGQVATLDAHCATKLCGCWSVEQFNCYAINNGYGGAGVDFIVDQGSTNESDFPPVSGDFRVAYIGPVGNNPPWTAFETVTCELFFTAQTLPDPGPYTILSAQNHRFRSNTTVLNLDRAIRFATPSALCVAGTTSGTYDGMKFGYEWGDDFTHSATQISISVPFTTGVTAGTVLRHWDAPFDEWYSLTSPSGPPPSLPSGC